MPIGLRDVLRADLRRLRCAHADGVVNSCHHANRLLALRNQTFIRIEVDRALWALQGVALRITILLFDEPAVERVVAVAGNRVVLTIADLAQAVLAIVDIAGDAGCVARALDLLGEVACGIPLIASRSCAGVGA